VFENWITGVAAGIKNAQPKAADCAFLYHDQTLQTPTDSLPGKYLTNAQSHITLTVASSGGSNGQLSRPYYVSSACHNRRTTQSCVSKCKGINP